MKDTNTKSAQSIPIPITKDGLDVSETSDDSQIYVKTFLSQEEYSYLIKQLQAIIFVQLHCPYSHSLRLNKQFEGENKNHLNKQFYALDVQELYFFSVKKQLVFTDDELTFFKGYSKESLVFNNSNLEGGELYSSIVKNSEKFLLQIFENLTDLMLTSQLYLFDKHIPYHFTKQIDGYSYRCKAEGYRRIFTIGIIKGEVIYPNLHIDNLSIQIRPNNKKGTILIKVVCFNAKDYGAVCAFSTVVSRSQFILHYPYVALLLDILNFKG
jgi:hypothetical protein